MEQFVFLSLLLIQYAINSNCKATKYKALHIDLHSTYSGIKFVNLSMSALGIVAASSDSLLAMFKDFNSDQNSQIT